MILGIDAGNYETKVMGPYGPIKFLSDIGEYRDRRLENNFGHDDMVCEYRGKKFFAGSLARYESEFTGSIMGMNKAHEDTLLRVLLAIHRYTDSQTVRIVTGQTIDNHIPELKQKIKGMLIGRHTLTVNGIEKTFNISRVEVAAEGAAAFLSEPIPGLIRLIDVGSGTVNFATLLDNRYVDRDSFTLPFGANTTKSNDKKEMARAIVAQAIKKWSVGDTVYVVGGVSEIIAPYLTAFFPNTKILKPQIKDSTGIKALHPVFANAVGFYTIARRLYEAPEKAQTNA